MHYSLQILSDFVLLCSLEFKVVRIEILHVCSTYHWLPPEFCLRFFENFEL
jgi:hypothetical protein